MWRTVPAVSDDQCAGGWPVRELPKSNHVPQNTFPSAKCIGMRARSNTTIGNSAHNSRRGKRLAGSSGSEETRRRYKIQAGSMNVAGSTVNVMASGYVVH